METLYLKALGLGLAGFDPSGGVLALAMLGAGATRRAVALFCVAYLAGTIFLLSALSWLLHERVPGTNLRLFDEHPATRAGVELVVGILLLGLAIYRFRHRHDPKSEKTRQLPVSLWATGGMGILLALGVVGDPALLAFAVVASTSPSLSTIVIAQVIAVLASKCLVVVILCAVAFNRDDRAIERFRAWWLRCQPTIQRILTVVIAVVGLALALNGLWWYATGNLILG